MSAIAVVGAGGVGGLVAARLARAGHEVHLVARGRTRDVIAAHGVTLRGPDGDFTATMTRVSDDAAALGPVALVLLAVKAWQVAEVAPSLVTLARGDTIVAPLQNGVEAAGELARALGEERVVGGLCHMLASAEEAGVVRWMGAPPSVTLGARHASQAAAVEHCASLLRPALHVRVVDDIDAALWEKLLFIAAFGAAGAASHLTAGPLRRDPEWRARLEGAMNEAAAVAAARGVRLSDAAVATAMKRVDALPEDATASLMRDLLAGRPSELHQLIGAVVRLGRDAAVATPVSAALYTALTPLEDRARG
jgi:2-dehydropantoate 2-reductase